LPGISVGATSDGLSPSGDRRSSAFRGGFC
jgi:hypothetical protein